MYKYEEWQFIDDVTAARTLFYQLTETIALLLQQY
jgi:hypothetical protein